MMNGAKFEDEIDFTPKTRECIGCKESIVRFVSVEDSDKTEYPRLCTDCQYILDNLVWFPANSVRLAREPVMMEA